LRNQYSQDEAERKPMTEKIPRLRMILTGLPDFSTNSGNERSPGNKKQALNSRKILPILIPNLGY
jgi:hypothetical protein